MFDLELWHFWCDFSLFCQKCINILIQRQGRIFLCPSCRTQCDAQNVKRTGFVDRMINKLKVKCPNYEITKEKALYLSQISKMKPKDQNIENLRNKRDSRRDRNRNKRDHETNSNRARSRSRSRSRERFVSSLPIFIEISSICITKILNQKWP